VLTLQLVVGMNAAWAATQLALAAFFAVAALGRDRKFGLFAVVCLAMGLQSVGLAGAHLVERPGSWLAMAILAQIGGAWAAAANLCFAFSYTGTRFPRPARIALVLVLVGVVAIGLSGSAWESGSARIVTNSFFGIESKRMVGTTTPWISVVRGVIAVELLLAWFICFRAFRRHVRHAGWACLGLTIVIAAAANDMAVSRGLGSGLYIIPMAFLVYAFGVAMSLPQRYRVATGALEVTRETLADTAEQLQSSTAELRVVRAELDQKAALAAVGELSATVAHEVRNPVAVITNACATLRRPSTSDADRDTLLGVVGEESQRLDRLVTELLKFSMPIRASRRDIPLREFVAPYLDEAQNRYGVETDFREDSDDANPLALNADPALMPSVFRNLIENACQALDQANASEKLVVVRANTETFGGVQMVSIEVSDTGPGMDSDVIRRALDPFFTTRATGTGLGLAVVGRIVEAHQGTLEIRSTPGAGTKVTVRLPRAIGEELDEVPVDSTIRPTRQTRSVSA
jgi:signal transduction histidine kinase